MLNSAAITARTLPGNKGATSRTDPRALQNPYITFQDIFDLAAIRPETPIQPLLGQYARLFTTVLERGASVQDLVRMFHEEVSSGGSQPVVADLDGGSGCFSAGQSSVVHDVDDVKWVHDAKWVHE